jgi:hypothetical protein
LSQYQSTRPERTGLGAAQDMVNCFRCAAWRVESSRNLHWQTMFPRGR